MQKRPGLITVIGILGIIGGVLGILGAVAIFGLAGVAASADSTVSLGSSIPYAVFLLVIAIAQIIACVGLLQMKIWGYWGVVALEVIGIVLAVVGSTLGTSSGVSLVIILYLLFGNVRSKFA
jgi:hypothetical protein